MIIYRTDSHNRISFLNDEFIEFARQNWNPRFSPSDLLNKQLLDQISDQSTRHLYELLLAKIRRNGAPVVLDYRCDSQALRRYLRLEIRALPHDELEWRSTTIREVPREPVGLLESNRDTDGRLIKICSWCKRGQVPEYLKTSQDHIVGDWLELEEMISLLGAGDQAALPNISHGICPTCFHRVSSEVEED